MNIEIEKLKHELGLDTEIIQIKSDRIFRDLFNENNMEVLEYLVSSILECPMDEIKGKVSIKNTKLTDIAYLEKEKNVDLLVEYKGQKYIIELNNNYNGNYLRNVLYAFNIILNSYKPGDVYPKDIVQVILVNLNWHRSKNNQKEVEVIDYKFPAENIDTYLLRSINISLDQFDKIPYNKVKESDLIWKLFTIKSKNEIDGFNNEKPFLNNYFNDLTLRSDNSNYRSD